MRKLISFILIALVFVMLVSCGGARKIEGVNEPKDVLEKVWTTYGEDEKFFAMGGDYNNIVDNAPGAYDITDKDSTFSQLVVNETALGMIDGAASLTHAMNANTFTGASYHIADGSNADEFISEMKTSIENNQWVCGFPEKLLVAKLTEEYVVVAFGETTIVDKFNEKLAAQYDFAEISVEPIE